MITLDDAIFVMQRYASDLRTLDLPAATEAAHLLDLDARMLRSLDAYARAELEADAARRLLIGAGR